MRHEPPTPQEGLCTAAVILAAGQASRMGTPKTLLDFRGVPLVRHAVLTALAAGYDEVSVVVARPIEGIEAALDGLPAAIVVNDRARDGIGTSIAAGVEALGSHVGWMALLLADQPFVPAAYLAQLRARARSSPCVIVASRYEGTVGVPALFARTVFPRLARLGADQGCKSVIRELSAQAEFVDCHEAGIDIDTPEDYLRAHALDLRV